MRAATVDTLRAYITGGKIQEQTIATLQKAANHRVTFTSTFCFSNPPKVSGLFKQKSTPGSTARTAVDILHHYLRLTGPSFGLVCQQCQKVAERLKPNQRFCSDQCRWDFWNEKKMEGYYLKKQQERRAYKKKRKEKSK